MCTKSKIKNLIEFLVNKYGVDGFEKVLKRSGLYHVYCENSHEAAYLINKSNVMMMQNELLKITNEFEQHGIDYIAFKGVVLANQIYENIYARVFSDLDIYVPPRCFDSALKILYDNGYTLKRPDVLLGSHHAALIKGRIVVELHRNILNPFTQIDEAYLLSHTEAVTVSDYNVQTFDSTGTLLHLFYHLYMDAWFSHAGTYVVFAKQELPIVKRFLLRAYEIAVFAEKYYKQINWSEIISDIKHQNLRIIFKQIINDILEVFPDVFPKTFIDIVNQKKYVFDERDVLYKYLLDADVYHTDVETLLCDYIDSNWTRRRCENIRVVKNGAFSVDNLFIVDKEKIERYPIHCDVEIWKKNDGVVLRFHVRQFDFCFSDIGNYDTQASDGIHLILCGTEKYSYNSIFLFPKLIEGNVTVLPIDVLNNKNVEIDETRLETSYEQSGKGYTITAMLKNKFLEEKSLDNYFYLGMVVSNCSTMTKKRKSILILSNPSSQWYNPIYFAKIDLRDGE